MSTRIVRFTGGKHLLGKLLISILFASIIFPIVISSEVNQPAQSVTGTVTPLQTSSTAYSSSYLVYGVPKGSKDCGRFTYYMFNASAGTIVGSITSNNTQLNFKISSISDFNTWAQLQSDGSYYGRDCVGPRNTIVTYDAVASYSFLANLPGNGKYVLSFINTPGDKAAYVTVTMNYRAASELSIPLWEGRTTCALGAVPVTIYSIQFDNSPRAGGDQSKYDSILQRMNATFFAESYGRMWLVGKFGGYFKLPKKFADYPSVDIWSGNDMRVKLANDTATTITSRIGSMPTGKVIFVYSDSVWGFVPRRGGSIALLNDQYDVYVYMHEFGHLLGLPDLYDYDLEAKHSDADLVKGLDRMSNENSQEGFSSWSRMQLCWIRGKEIATVTVAQMPTSTKLDTFSDPTSVTKALVISLTGSSQLVIERRGTAFYLFYANLTKSSGHGVLVYRNFLNHPYFDPTFQITITVPDQTSIVNVDPPKQAAEVASALNLAKNTIDSAWSANRTDGLVKANTTLQQAWLYYVVFDFGRSLDLARTATSLAEKATVPASYDKARQLIMNASKLAGASYTTQESIAMRDRAYAILRLAVRDYNAKNWDDAIKDANSAILLFHNAKEQEASASTSQQGLQLGSYVYAIPVVIVLAIAAFLICRKRAQRPHA